MSEMNGPGAVTGTPLLLLRIEGMSLFAAGLIIFPTTGASWWLFVALILAPDLTLLAYLAGPRIGSIVYNAAHTTIMPILVAIAGIIAGSTLTKPIALIWLAHIGIDRALGYGLKYADGFSFTHLGRVGKNTAT